MSSEWFYRYGKYEHAIFGHAGVQFRFVSGQTANTESEVTFKAHSVINCGPIFGNSLKGRG